MEETIFYSCKFPQTSELKAVNKFGPILVIISLIVLAILSKRPTWEKLFFLPTGLLFTLIFYRIILIHKFIIKRMDQVFTENAELSKKGKIYEVLLMTDINFAVLRKREKILNYFLAFVLIVFIILSIIIEIKPIYKFYFVWFYILIGFSVSFVFSLLNIFNYFCKIMETCYQKIINDKDCNYDFSERYFLIINWSNYEKKGRRLLILMGVIALLFFTAHIFLIQYQRLIYLSLSLINYILLGLITFDVNRIVEKCVYVLSSYDEHVKSKLGMVSKSTKFKSFEIKTAHAAFLKDMKGTNDAHKSLWKEMNKDIKDIFK